MLGQMAAKIILSIVLVPVLITLFVGLGKKLDSGPRLPLPPAGGE